MQLFPALASKRSRLLQLNPAKILIAVRGIKTRDIDKAIVILSKRYFEG